MGACPLTPETKGMHVERSVMGNGRMRRRSAVATTMKEEDDEEEPENE
jgi:hypothetical protein